jgi:four helix bundle protein
MDETRKESRDLSTRLFEFALRVVRLCQRLDEKPGVPRTISYQLIKAGTSIGANYEEGQAGQSRADFISKNCIALKEARESHYWLRLIHAAELLPPASLESLIDEAGQIVKILGSIVIRSRQNT